MMFTRTPSNQHTCMYGYVHVHVLSGSGFMSIVCLACVSAMYKYRSNNA